MKLNPDCIRDILLAVEELSDGIEVFEYDRYQCIPERLKDYEHTEILYHCRQCSMADLVCNMKYFDNGNSFIIEDLTPAGHEFLANIRSESVWGKTKDISKKLGVGSLRGLADIAISVVSEIIKVHLLTT